MKKTSVLIIGFPSSIAAQTARALCDAGVHVNLLVSKQDAHHGRALRGIDKAKLTLLTGNAEHIDFGLAGDAYMALAQTTRAVLSLMPQAFERDRPSAGVLMRAGQELAEFARTATPPLHALHLSGIDIRGTGTGLFSERDVCMGQSPPTALSRERLRVERALFQLRDHFATTIVRVGVLAGDGPGLYPFIPLALAEPAFFARLDTRHLHFTPLETLVAFLVHWCQHPVDTGGRALHLLAPDDATLSQRSEFLVREAQRRFPKGIAPDAWARKHCEALGFTARAFWQHNGSNAPVSSAWTDTFCREHGFALAERITVDWAQHVSQLAEKRRPAPPHPKGRQT